MISWFCFLPSPIFSFSRVFFSFLLFLSFIPFDFFYSPFNYSPLTYFFFPSPIFSLSLPHFFSSLPIIPFLIYFNLFFPLCIQLFSSHLFILHLFHLIFIPSLHTPLSLSLTTPHLLFFFFFSLSHLLISHGTCYSDGQLPFHHLLPFKIPTIF